MAVAIFAAVMKKHIHSARDFLLPIIDFFHPPFSKLMDLQTFRYAACGGANTVLGLIVYYISFKFILREQMLDLGFFAFKAHIAALFFSFCVSFPVGFLLMKYVVFPESNVKGRKQLFRYLFSFIFTLILNYFILKIFVERLHIFVMLSQLITTVIIVATSYIIQRYFTFKVVKEAE